MALAGNVSLINATPFTWLRTAQSIPGGVVNWDFPTSVHPGNAVSVHASWSMLGGGVDSIGAQSRYSITLEDNTTVSFQIQANNAIPPSFTVFYDNTSTFGNPPGTKISIDLVPGAITPFIFSGKIQESFESTNPPQDWMHQNLGSIGCLPLSRLCMPASHDSGMSTLTGKASALVTDDNTLTHYTDIAGQLAAGFRYFDIRPVVASGQFYTGHYSDINELGISIWQGGNGQSLASIITQINTFIASNQELVILDLSHTLDTDNDYTLLKPNQVTQLLTQLLALNHRFIPTTQITDLTTLPLKSFISSSPCVLILLSDTIFPSPFPPAFANVGFYSPTQLPIFNSFSNTDSPSKMSADQLAKMSAHPRPSKPNGGPLFLLSWTLTTLLSIRSLSLSAHANLFRDLWPAISANTYPNFIMIDGIGAADSLSTLRNVAALAVGIMQFWNEDCQA